MSKEELEKEAKEKYHNHKTIDFQGFYNHHYYYLGYVESAEPREKQIQIDAEQIRALQKQNGELTDKVKELEETIDKLREQLALRYDLEDKIKELEAQTSKAKEIIKNLMVYVPVDLKEYEEAEQFISEVEK